MAAPQLWGAEEACAWLTQGAEKQMFLRALNHPGDAFREPVKTTAATYWVIVLPSTCNLRNDRRMLNIAGQDHHVHDTLQAFGGISIIINNNKN